MLDTMLAAGLEYLFVSNADNLGAVMDTRLLGHFAQHQLPFMMEVADRTHADRKGGHLAKDHAGRLLLRESAQCPDADVSSFQDIKRHHYFNTNNLWINLHALKALLEARGNVLGLAMIRNQKTLDPRDPDSPAVYQLETAMGSAIAAFDGASAVRVPRTRFAPVKTTSDLLAIRSDSYVLSEDFRILPSPERSSPAAVVNLDPAYFKNVDDLDARFPHGPPSLIHCETLRVVGDVRFGANVTCEGRTAIINESPAQAVIAAGTRCVGTMVL
jgi:UTP--glucose-1-phosphate uridylyltransferase